MRLSRYAATIMQYEVPLKALEDGKLREWQAISPLSDTKFV